VGVGVGVDVGLAVGLIVGLGVGVDDGLGVGVEDGLGVGVGVGLPGTTLDIRLHSLVPRETNALYLSYLLLLLRGVFERELLKDVKLILPERVEIPPGTFAKQNTRSLFPL